jgi:hypothetical protein
MTELAAIDAALGNLASSSARRCLRMGQVIGRSTSNGGEPADSPIHRRNLISTIWHTLFDVGAHASAPMPGPRGQADDRTRADPAVDRMICTTTTCRAGSFNVMRRRS